MIFRAVTALAVACIILPKEPDLGLNRPAGAWDQFAVVADAICEAGTIEICDAVKPQDGTHPAVRSFMERLRQVKTDIEEDERLRGAHQFLVGETNEGRPGIGRAAPSSD